MPILTSQMKKQPPSIIRQMWHCVVLQLLMAALITACLVTISLVLLHSVETSNESLHRALPTIRQHLQEEQDPVKLRQKANGLLEGLVSDGEIQESILQMAVKMSVGFGLCL